MSLGSSGVSVDIGGSLLGLEVEDVDFGGGAALKPSWAAGTLRRPFSIASSAWYMIAFTALIMSSIRDLMEEGLVGW